MRVAALIATLALVIACSYGATTSYQVGSAMYDITGPAAEGLLFVCLFVCLFVESVVVAAATAACNHGWRWIDLTLLM
jgi:hypothetical protein